MSNIFCSQCGTKHSVGARFCSACGTPLSAIAATQRAQKPAAEIVETEDGFARPSKLDYEIQSEASSVKVYRAEDIFNASPIDETDKVKRPQRKTKRISQKQLLEESLRECGPSRRAHEIE